MPKAIPLLTLEARIKRDFRLHLRQLGFQRRLDGALAPGDLSKESLRALHRSQKQGRIAEEAGFIKEFWPRGSSYFANGRDLDIANIKPRLELITAGTWQSKLFRLAGLTWSVPVSNGYGRRLRFLVWDESNSKLIGLIGLCDPVFNLRVRDEYIHWTVNERKSHLLNVMDAYVLGAVPPYNMLLGGKLVACLLRSQEVRLEFQNKYGSSRSIISGESRPANLVLVTTSSALGRSSVYNRLRIGAIQYLKPLGYTLGWGHFHIPQELFDLMRLYLKSKNHSYATNNRFGDGPNWRFRVVRQTLQLLGLRPDLLRHGVRRQVFACELADNATSFLRGTATQPQYADLLTAAEIGCLARRRWLEPRAIRSPEYLLWKSTELLNLLSIQVPRSNPVLVEQRNLFYGDEY